MITNLWRWRGETSFIPKRAELLSPEEQDQLIKPSMRWKLTANHFS
ncbi:hypothetical protein OK016_29025 [Vibrio chagasii]|nr:hypothetical protein [Vibrio chagasii]